MIPSNLHLRDPRRITLPNPPHGTIHFPKPHFLRFACALILGAALMVPCIAGAARFTSPGDSVFETNQGVVNLAWDVDTEGVAFELQQSPNSAFPESETRTRYQGPDPGSVISGLPEGSHHFRVRHVPAEGIPGEWSDLVEVRVEYMATKWVVTLLIFGAIVFLATLTAIITGHLRTRKSLAKS